MRYEAAAVVPCPPPHRMPYSAALVIIIILVSIQMSREGASGQEMTKLVGPAGWMATLPHHAGADRCQSGAQSDTAPPWCGAVRFKNKEICLSVPSDVPVPLHEDCCIKTQKKINPEPFNEERAHRVAPWPCGDLHAGGAYNAAAPRWSRPATDTAHNFKFNSACGDFSHSNQQHTRTIHTKIGRKVAPIYCRQFNRIIASCFYQRGKSVEKTPIPRASNAPWGRARQTAD